MLIETEAINQIEGFLNWAIEDNPGEYQLNYCLGFFNWQIRGDNLQAIENLQKFLSLCNKDEFVKEQDLAKKK